MTKIINLGISFTLFCILCLIAIKDCFEENIATLIIVGLLVCAVASIYNILSE